MVSKKINLNSKIEKINKAAAKLTAALSMNGESAYWVGGTVRDIMLARDIVDIDVATSLHTADVVKILKSLKLPVYDLGEKFGTIGTVLNGLRVEITSYRKESNYSDSRHPQKIKFVKSAEEDSKRRDFTINALYFNPLTKTIFDYVGGLKDIKTKKLKFIGSADKRIKEDALRLLRAVRFNSTLGFKLDNQSIAALKKHKKLVKNLSVERVKAELDKIICNDNFYQGVLLLDKYQLLEELLPELTRLKNVKQSKNYHAEGDAFVHTMKSLKSLSGKSSKILRYATLFHDLGKFDNGKAVMRDGRKHISFPEHGPKGADIFLKIAKRLKFSSSEAKDIAYLIQHHMDLRYPSRITDATIAKWIIAKVPLADLSGLRRADDLGAIWTDAKGKVIPHDFKLLDLFEKKVILFSKRAKSNLINGDEIMELLNLKQSEEVGYYIEKIKELQILGKIREKAQAIDMIKRMKSENKFPVEKTLKSIDI